MKEEKFRDIRKLRPRRLLVAVCAVLLLLMAACAGESGGVKLSNVISEAEESSYQISIGAEKLPLRALSRDFRREAGETIRRQYAEFPPWSDRFPGSWYKTFNSWADACDYIGLELTEPLPGAGETKLWTDGDSKGRIRFLSLSQDDFSGSVSRQNSVLIYTRNQNGELTTGFAAREELRFGEETRAAASGREALILRSSPNEMGYQSIAAYLVDGAALYILHLNCQEPDLPQAEAELEAWLQRM